MPYYDIVFDSCNIDDALSAKLGFSRIGMIPNDIGFADLSKRGASGEKNLIASGPVGNLIGAAGSGVSAIYIPDYQIDKKLIATMADNEAILCVSLSDVMEPYGLKRSQLIFRIGKLFAYAKKEGVDVAFLTLAKARSRMCSYMQIIELAKLIGADEDYARRSVGEINGRLLMQ